MTAPFAEHVAAQGGAPSTNGSAPTERPWPWPEPLAEAAFHGVAGDITRAIEPHTEADSAAILLQILVLAGTAFDRNPGFEVEATRHHTNEFTVIVGASATSRKGSAFGQARRPVELADPSLKERVMSGASSAEGLIWQVRDPIIKRRKAKGEEEKKRADPDGYVEEVEDPGVDDKRLVIFEPELASLLQRMGRQGNSLSAVTREAWDAARSTPW